MMLKALPKVEGKTGWPWSEEVNSSIYDERELWPKISIVTPSFNQGNFIEETIRSVLLQNYPNLEFIIIDGGSTDNTVDIIKKYQSIITTWSSEPDDGQSDAINKGIAKSTGDIFNWLNSDDYYLPDTLYNVALNFLNHKTDVLCGQEYLDNGKQQTVSTGSTIKDKLEETLFLAHIDQPPTFFKLSVIKELKGVNTCLHYLMDSELWIKYLLKYGQNNIVKVNEVYNVFRIHSHSKTGSLLSKFEIERAFLHYLLLKKANLPKPIIEAIFNDRAFDHYKRMESNFEWNTTLDSRVLHKLSQLLLRPYAFKSYFSYNIVLCRVILSKIGILRIIKDRELFTLYLKVNLIPKSILSRLR